MVAEDVRIRQEHVEDYISLLVVLVAPAVAYLGQLLIRRRERGAESPEQRIQRLTNSLSEAANVAGEIEAEIRRRQGVAERLQQDIQQYERLREVNQEEIEAVAQVLGGQLRKEGRRSFWVGVLMNFVFFVFGVAATVVLSLLFGL